MNAQAHPATPAAPLANPPHGARSAIAPAAPAAAAAAPDQTALPLVAQLGSEVAGRLSSALDRVLALAATGRIDRSGLRALHDEIESARRAAIVGQQLARLVAGSVAIGTERLDLSQVLHAALMTGGHGAGASALELRLRLQPAAVDSDAALLFTLLQTVLDWAAEHATGRVDLQVDVLPAPPVTRLSCRYAHTAPDTVDSAAMPLDGDGPALDRLAWRLLEQTALLLGVPLQRDDDARYTVLTLDFAEAPPAHAPGPLNLVLADRPGPLGPATVPDALAGLQVLVLSPRREVRNAVAAALRPLAVLVDAVDSVAGAQHFCQEGLPHVLLHDEGIDTGALQALREVLPAPPAGPLPIALGGPGRWLELHQIAGAGHCHVGRDGIHTALPLALRLLAAAHARS